MTEIQTVGQWKETDRYKNLIKDYASYMDSNEWKSKKKQLIDIFGNECEACGFSLDLQCHHGSYSKVGNEPLHHIFLLCDSCHIEYHSCYHQFGVSIEQTEIFISKKLGLVGMNEYSKKRRNILRSAGIKVPKSNF